MITAALRFGANDTTGLTPTGAAASYQGPTWTPGSNRWCVITVESAVATGTANLPTVTGNGITWALIDDGITDADVAFESGRQRLSKWWGKHATPTSGKLTVAFGGQTQAGCRVLAEEFDGVDSNGALVVLQVQVDTETAQATVGATMAGFAPGSAISVAAASKSTGTPSAGAPLGYVGQTTNATGKLYAAFYEDEDLTPSITFSGANHCAIIALELAPLDTTSEWTVEAEVLFVAVDVPPPDPDPDPNPSEPSAVVTDPIVVAVYNADRIKVAPEVPDVITLDLVLRKQAVGSWVMTLPANSTSAPHLRNPGARVVIIRNGKTILSGPVRRRNDSYSNEGSLLTVAGPDDNVLLADTVAKPQPATAAPPYSVSEYDVRTGIAETVMHAYVEANMGATASPGRTRAGVTFSPDLARGATVTGRARWHTLLEVLQTLARQSVAEGGADVDFRVLQQGDQLVFTTSVGVDRRATAKFSTERGNLRAFDYEQAAPDATYVYTGGQGEGTARAVAEAENTAATADWDRIERFKDRRDIPTGAELITAAAEALIEARERTRLSLEPIDVELLRYGRDYDLGDIVTVEIVVPRPEGPTAVLYGSAGDTYADIFSGDLYGDFGAAVVSTIDVASIVDAVCQVALSYAGGEGETVTPQVGTDAVLETVPRLLQKLSAQQAEIDSFKRR